MNELIIELSEISPREFFGQQNANIELLKKYYPKLKLVARGNKIKVYGDDEHLEEFDKRITMLMEHFSKYNKLDENAIERILTSEKTEDYETSDKSGDVLVHGVNGRLIKAQTANQRKIVELSKKNDMVFVVGPAGTGKTYTCVALAVKALKEKEVRRIILTRPAVEAGENLGFLPGDLKEKLDPYMQPLYDALRDMIPAEKLMNLIDLGIIEIAPLAFMRGRTLDKAFVILDEGQNATINQMKMFLTRMGMDANFIITGDVTQIDLPKKQHSGLTYAIERLKDIEDIGFVMLNKNDVIRHKIVKQIIEAFDEDEDE